jgi:hypothetical protein
VVVGGRLKKLLFILAFSLCTGCQSIPPPYEDYSLARVAMDSARSVQAARHSPGYWHQAEESYRKARLFFKDRDYSKAKEYFNLARQAAERAENSARLLRQKSGDVL